MDPKWSTDLDTLIAWQEQAIDLMRETLATCPPNQRQMWIAHISQARLRLVEFHTEKLEARKESGEYRVS